MAADLLSQQHSTLKGSEDTSSSNGISESDGKDHLTWHNRKNLGQVTEVTPGCSLSRNNISFGVRCYVFGHRRVKLSGGAKIFSSPKVLMLFQL